MEDITNCVEFKTLDDIVNALLEIKSKGISVSCDFYGYTLCSDTVTLDSAYLEVFCKTFEEFDKAVSDACSDFRLSKKETNVAIQRRIFNWISRGRKYIFPERYSEWNEFVITNAFYSFSSEMVEGVLELMELFESGKSLEEVRSFFDRQDYSGSAVPIIRNIMFLFSKQGPEFYEVTALRKLSLETKAKIEAKKEENIRLSQKNQHKSNGKKI